jgi:hypothetical protein
MKKKGPGLNSNLGVGSSPVSLLFNILSVGETVWVFSKSGSVVFTLKAGLVREIPEWF